MTSRSNMAELSKGVTVYAVVKDFVKRSGVDRALIDEQEICLNVGRMAISEYRKTVGGKLPRREMTEVLFVYGNRKKQSSEVTVYPKGFLKVLKHFTRYYMKKNYGLTLPEKIRKRKTA